MRVLVTGGAGFIGSHIVDSLIKKGHEVIIIDNLSTGFRENIHPKAKFYEMSICDEQVLEIFKQEEPDIVSHQAAQMDVRKSVENPIFDAEENIIGSLNIIINSVRFGVKKIIYASTGGAVYGEPEYLPVDEKHSINPISQYGISKHTVEHYLCLYALNYGLKYTSLRYPNVYGPRQNPRGEAGVVAIFTGKLLNEERPTIFGDGEQTRDYTYVDDVVEVNILAMRRGDNEIYNIGTGVEISVKEVFTTLAKVLRLNLFPVHAPERTGEINRICLDATKAERELGWRSKISFRDGILKTVEYYKSNASRRESLVSSD